ncbi:MAG: hypothetical protein AAGH15_17290 [Myxococcota bacterium]
MGRLVLAAMLLAGCTLITDPTSYEGGDPPDMLIDGPAVDLGPDAGADAGAD